MAHVSPVLGGGGVGVSSDKCIKSLAEICEYSRNNQKSYDDAFNQLQYFLRLILRLIFSVKRAFDL